MNPEKSIKEILEKAKEATSERNDTMKLLFDELLSYITLSLQEAYNTGYKDGYDCSKLDNSRY